MYIPCAPARVPCVYIFFLPGNVTVKNKFWKWVKSIIEDKRTVISIISVLTLVFSLQTGPITRSIPFDPGMYELYQRLLYGN